MIRLATQGDLPAVTAMLGRAFKDEPILAWSFGLDGDIEAEVRTFFENYDLHTQALGYLWVTDDLAGAAVWEPPGVVGLGSEIEAAIWPALAAFMPDGGERYEEFWTWADSLRPAEAHWYLNHVAVDEPHRGKGRAVELVEHGLDFARRDRAPACLETSSAVSAAFYERRGLRVTTEEDSPSGGPHVWFMRFDP